MKAAIQYPITPESSLVRALLDTFCYYFSVCVFLLCSSKPLTLESIVFLGQERRNCRKYNRPPVPTRYCVVKGAHPSPPPRYPSATSVAFRKLATTATVGNTSHHRLGHPAHWPISAQHPPAHPPATWFPPFCHPPLFMIPTPCGHLFGSFLMVPARSNPAVCPWFAPVCLADEGELPSISGVFLSCIVTR